MKLGWRGWIHSRTVACALTAAVAGCGAPAPGGDAASSNDASGTNDAAGDTASGPGTAQLPPTTGRVDVEAWLATGAYRAWHCEPAPHPARAPSPHGINRICSNDALAATGAGDYPVGAAAVKELLDSSNQIIGYAVYVKLAATPSDGSNWYWYERVPANHPAPHDANGVVADGTGGSGPANTICVGCHSLASTGTPPGHDFVFTRVR